MNNKGLPQGLYKRLAAYSVAIAFSFGLTLSLYQIYNDYRLQDERLEQEIQQRVSAVQASAVKAIYEFDEQLGQLVIDALFEHPAVLEVTIIDDYGDNFLGEARRQASERPAWLPRSLAFNTQELTFELEIFPVNNQQNSQIKSLLQIQVDPYLVIGDFISRSWLVLITGIVRNTLLAFALLFLSYRFVTRPINELTQNLSQIDPFKDKETRLGIPAEHKDNELGSLASMTNTLLEKIQNGLASIQKLNRELNTEISERIEIETAINYADQQTAGITGISYINAMTRFLSKSLSIKGAMVAQVETIDAQEGFHCIAGCYDEQDHIDQFIPFNNTPFAEGEINQEFYIFSKKDSISANLFFHKNALIIPLIDHQSQLSGLLVLINEASFDEHFYFTKKPLLQIFSNRITSEIEREKQQHTIKYLAHTDGLTKLGNRYYFKQYIEKLTSDSNNPDLKIALIYLDLDRFKWVNDSFGHAIGDKLLVQVASRLKQIIPKDDLLCRIGGDEFALLLNLEQVGDEKIIAKKIQSVFEKPFSINNHLIVTKTSIGISIYPDSASSTQELIKNADIAMYIAKSNVEEKVQYFSSSIDSQLQRKIQIENALSEALKNSLLDVVYQPQFNLKSGKLFGVEALVRWKDKELGQINPSEFIPIAEETGLIHQLGQWVTSQACTQAYNWNTVSDTTLKVSINFSAPQLRSPLLVDEFLETIKRTKVKPQQIELEITETSLIEDIDVTAIMLKQLSQAGLNISIDDFGTGYSSLRYLKSLPINTLKIDQVFIAETEISKPNRNIIRAIIALAKAMDLEVIAEGVENKEQALFLFEHDCDYVQGFYYAKPMQAEEITQLLKTGFHAQTPGVLRGVSNVQNS